MDRMANSEVVSRSQLLLQYLLAIHLVFRVAGTFEHSPGASTVCGTAGYTECLA